LSFGIDLKFEICHLKLMEIVGHQKIINFFDKAIKAGNLSHAYLFCGPEHVGKNTMAINIAEKILGNASEINPDLLIIRPEIEEKKGITRKKGIPIEEIRELQRKIMLAPANSGFKIAIIDDADLLTKSAQNALLKILEEPPAMAILILVVQNQEKMLPTILSRCQIKKFGTVSGEELAGLVSPENKNYEKIIFWSLGRPGEAVNMMESEMAIKDREENLNELKKLFSQNVVEKFLLAEALSKDVSKLPAKLNWWLVATRQSLINEGGMLNISQQKALKICEKIGESIEILRETNSNPRLILENLMLEF
jgi:DNA polymerase III subunit delta'